MMKEDLFAKLKSDTGIRNSGCTGVFASVVDESQPAPYLIFSKVTTQQSASYCKSDDVQRAVYQFDSYAKTGLEAGRLALALKKSMVDFQGLMGSTHVNSVLLDNEIEFFDPEPGLFRVLTTLFIWHEVDT